MWNKLTQNIESRPIEGSNFFYFLVNICVSKSNLMFKYFNALLMRSVSPILKGQTFGEYVMSNRFSNQILLKQSDDDNLNEGKNEHFI